MSVALRLIVTGRQGSRLSGLSQAGGPGGAWNWEGGHERDGEGKLCWYWKGEQEMGRGRKEEGGTEHRGMGKEEWKDKDGGKGKGDGTGYTETDKSRKHRMNFSGS